MTEEGFSRRGAPQSWRTIIQILRGKATSRDLRRSAPIVEAIVISWLIAFGEYCFQVPANRIGYGEFTGYQLKIIQECTDPLELRGVFPFLVGAAVSAF